MIVVSFSDYKCIVQYAKYFNGRMAIQLIDFDDGSPIATASVNLPDVHMETDEIAIKDYNENKGVLDALVEAGIVSKPLRYESSGYVTIPICTVLPLNKMLYH